MTQRALLMLDDGVCFEGLACGAGAEAAGEVVFTTGMAGYQETLTDPSFSGQIITFTSAHIGNYGVSAEDDEAPLIRGAGAVFHDLFTPPPGPFPHWRAEESLNARLARQGVSGIHGVDTRALALHLREHGARNGIISALDLDRPSLLRRAQALPSMQGRDLARQAGTDKPYAYPGAPNATPGATMGATPDAAHGVAPGPAQGAFQGPRLKVAVLDFGCKANILRCLARQNMDLTVWPAASPASAILDSKPDGIFLSNGPGDPEPCTYAIECIRALLGRLPLFGICLGHQLLGLALGGRTYKLPFGHHGVNHPVIDLATRRVCVTSQNHGFCVDPDSLPGNAEPTHWNLNDDTLEGLRVTDMPAFSVQFHPEAAPGPMDAADLFSRFRDLILAYR